MLALNRLDIFLDIVLHAWCQSVLSFGGNKVLVSVLSKLISVIIIQPSMTTAIFEVQLTK